jgi:hypothetical protein
MKPSDGVKEESQPPEASPRRVPRTRQTSGRYPDSHVRALGCPPMPVTINRWGSRSGMTPFPRAVVSTGAPVRSTNVRTWCDADRAP